ncbi:MAG TPA: glycosyltransferase family 2 protein [Chitinophagaceae bacterium]|nr:glycosyltransferase family 2 protein [Chitinophagaceae bacterium]
MDVSIVIINYNTFSLTSDCIRSLKRETRGLNYELILVDNASTETDSWLFLQAFPDIKLIKSPVNGGFAHANNLGIAQAAGKYILLLNSDTLLTEDSISRSVEFCKTLPDAGVLGCRMVYPDGEIQYTARRFRGIGWELLDLFRFIPYMMPYHRRSRLMLGKYFRHDETVQCDWLNGAFFLFEKELLGLLPGKKLDERFFMYGEDQLWCEQIRALGRRNYFFAGTTIIHIGGGSTDPQRRLALRKIMIRNELAIMRARKGTGIYYLVFWIIYCGKEYTRNAIKWLVLKTTGRLLR